MESKCYVHNNTYNTHIGNNYFDVLNSQFCKNFLVLASN